MLKQYIYISTTSWVNTSGEHLFQIYRRLIGRPYIALARQDKIYRNISDALGRVRSDHEYCETQRLKLSSSIFTCCCPSRMVISPLYDVLGHTNHIFSESSWSQDIKTDITKCLILKYTNTNTQIHKYSILQSARKTQHVVYF